MGYDGVILEKDIDEVRIGEIYWIDKDDLKWEPGEKIATFDLSHKPLIAITSRARNQVFKGEEIPGIISKLKPKFIKY